MRRRELQQFIAIAGMSALADVSLATQPPCNTSDAAFNTACGGSALGALTTGRFNTAIGSEALLLNTTGSRNTADGDDALAQNTSGAYNTAIGTLALYSNLTGKNNTASGTSALLFNSAGNYNTADGAYALNHNTTGNYNSASGYYALKTNTTGIYNAAFGAGALLLADGANQNTAMGTGSLYHDTTGYDNAATGFAALFHNRTGFRNTAVGVSAGANLDGGSYNTYIGYWSSGLPNENFVTRIGAQTTDTSVPGQPTTYITGIYNTGVTGGLPVYVTSSGQLGFSASSERYKTDITSLADGAAKLSQLRPVSFHLKNEPGGAVQYGLIAEEVDRVYPELVIRDAAGGIQGVRYDELAPMLLGEAQKQQEVIAAQDRKIDVQAGQIRELQHQLAGIEQLKEDMQAALRELKAARDAVVAQR